MFDRSFHHRHISDAPARRRARGIGAGGFTLIELLMVMVIVSVLAGLIVPKLIGFVSGRSANHAATQIVALARYARAQAISEGRMYRLNVDPSSRQYWLTAETNGEYDAPAGEYGSRYTLPDGVSMETDIPVQDGGTYVAFTPTGRVDFDSTTAPMATGGSSTGASSVNGSFGSMGAGGGSGPTVFGSGTLGILDTSGPQSAQIILMDQTHASVTVACRSSTELFHIVQAGEAL
jgi:prepilin-type N-terminal cleavage/methylation domain-containing protein